METEFIELDSQNLDLEKIKNAAEVIDNGGLVAFPTETVYGIGCRVEEGSLAKLDEIKERPAEKYYTLHIAKKGDIHEYVPSIPLAAKKLIENAWPGPLTVIFELSEDDLRKQYEKFGTSLCQILYKNESVGVRCPNNLIASALLTETKSPVVAPSANLQGKEPAITGEEVLSQLEGKIDIVLDGGYCHYGRSSSVVKIGKKGCEVLREGVYTSSEIEAMSKVNILFICTGNTCRSPIAEGFGRKYLMEKLDCTVDELDRIGYKISSAGVMAASDLPASHEAIEVCTAKGVDLKDHKSSLVTSELVEKSDLIFVMCRSYLEAIRTLAPASTEKCFLLDKNDDIPDPIAGGHEVYYRCSRQIEDAVKARFSEFII